MAKGFLRAITTGRGTMRRQGAAVVAAIEQTMTRTIKPVVQRELDVSARKFKKKPKFVIEIDISRDAIALIAGPDVRGNLARWPARPSAEWIYHLVDKGTKPHKIEARLKPTLRFQTEYAPITKPPPGGVQPRSGGPGKKSGPWASPISVQHPGTEARNFTAQIADAAFGLLARDAVINISKAVTKARQ